MQTTESYGKGFIFKLFKTKGAHAILDNRNLSFVQCDNKSSKIRTTTTTTAATTTVAMAEQKQQQTRKQTDNSHLLLIIYREQTKIYLI